MMTAPSRWQTGLVLLLLAIAGGLLVTYKTNFNSQNGVNVTESEVNERIALQDVAPPGSDCQHSQADGTCEANEMYKDAVNNQEAKENDIVANDAVTEPNDAVEEGDTEDDGTWRADQVTEADNEDSECRDYHEKCDEWASVGECRKNPRYMLSKKGCRKSCLVCGTM